MFLVGGVLLILGWFCCGLEGILWIVLLLLGFGFGNGKFEWVGWCFVVIV